MTTPEDLILRHAFLGQETKLVRGGPAQFLIWKAQEMEALLDHQGGIGPYQFSCIYEGHGMYVMTAEELPLGGLEKVQRDVLRPMIVKTREIIAEAKKPKRPKRKPAKRRSSRRRAPA